MNSEKLMWPKSATRFGKKCYQIWQKFTKKCYQIGAKIAKIAQVDQSKNVTVRIYHKMSRDKKGPKYVFPFKSTVSKLLSKVEPWSVKWMCPKSATRFVKKLPKSATRLGKKSPKWQKFAKVVKNRQSGKKSPKWLKVLKLGSKGFQMVPGLKQHGLGQLGGPMRGPLSRSRR